MTAIPRRRRRAGTILAECNGLIDIDNLIPLTIPPICTGGLSATGFMQYEDGGIMQYEDGGRMEYESDVP